MKILQLHADWIEYTPIEKEIGLAEETEKKIYKLDDVLVLFTSIEKNDNESLARKAIDDAKEFLGRIGCNKILIYPFAQFE
jgi:threonyl-tRNA synthetase